MLVQYGWFGIGSKVSPHSAGARWKFENILEY